MGFIKQDIKLRKERLLFVLSTNDYIPKKFKAIDRMSVGFYA